MKIFANRAFLLTMLLALSAALAGCGSETQVVSQPTATLESSGPTPTANRGDEATQAAPATEPATVARATDTAPLPTIVPASTEPPLATAVSALPSMIFFSAPN